MTKLLTTSDPDLTDGVLEAVLDSGVEVPEAVVSLVEVIRSLAAMTTTEDQIMDEVSDLISEPFEGGV